MEKQALVGINEEAFFNNPIQTKRAGGGTQELEKALDVANDFAIVVRDKDSESFGTGRFQETIGNLRDEGESR